METSTKLAETPAAAMTGIDRSWCRVGRDAGYLAGAGFLITTALFLLDALNLLGAGPQYHRTSAGPLSDEATFWAAVFSHQHRILWDIIARDTIGPLAFVALIVVSLAVRRLVATEAPQSQLMALFLLVGGVIAALMSLIYLGEVEFWRIAGWSGQVGQVSMVAVGRDSVAISNLTTWPESFGYLVIAAGLVCLGWLSRNSERLPSWLGLVAYLEACSLVGLALAETTHADAVSNLLSLLTGALIAPVLAFSLGQVFGRAIPRAATSI